MYKEYCIYIHKNRQNNKVYVGQTCQKPQRRWQKGKGYKNCYYFFNAINKYGWDSFEHIILKQHLTLEEANYWEKYYIQEYNSINPQFGYNIREGGNTISEKYREVICLNTKEIFNTISDAAEKYLNNRSEGHISSVCKGTRKHAGKIGNEFLSWAYLDEYLDNPDKFKNFSKKKKGHTDRKIICLNTNHIFNTIQEAAQWAGQKGNANIIKVCKGERKTSGKHPQTKEPLRWAYYDDCIS